MAGFLSHLLRQSMNTHTHNVIVLRITKEKNKTKREEEEDITSPYTKPPTQIIYDRIIYNVKILQSIMIMNENRLHVWIDKKSNQINNNNRFND